MPFELYLKKHGFEEKAVECCCPHCVTVAMFTANHPQGKYILICPDRAVVVFDGCYIDSGNSADEIVLYYYKKEK